MPTDPPRRVHAHDTPVQLRRPAVAGIASLLTLGLVGAVHHYRMTRDVARFGRRRGAMPFAFIPVDAAASTVAWVAGMLLWATFVASGAYVVGEVVAGRWDSSPEDITTFASLGILLVPMWVVAVRTMARIRTVRHMVGTTGSMPSPIVAAALTVLLPPLGSWHAQRQLNRAWREWRA